MPFKVGTRAAVVEQALGEMGSVTRVQRLITETECRFLIVMLCVRGSALPSVKQTH